MVHTMSLQGPGQSGCFLGTEAMYHNDLLIKALDSMADAMSDASSHERCTHVQICQLAL